MVPSGWAPTPSLCMVQKRSRKLAWPNALAVHRSKAAQVANDAFCSIQVARWNRVWWRHSPVGHGSQLWRCQSSSPSSLFRTGIIPLAQMKVIQKYMEHYTHTHTHTPGRSKEIRRGRKILQDLQDWDYTMVGVTLYTCLLYCDHFLMSHKCPYSSTPGDGTVI